MPDYIFNTTALSNFAAIDRLDLLADHYRGQAFTTVEVGDELRRGFHAGYAYLEAAWQQLETVSPSGWLRVLSPESAVEHTLRAEFDELLDPGEASCLTLAISRQLVFAPTIWPPAGWLRLEMSRLPAHWVFSSPWYAQMPYPSQKQTRYWRP